MKFFLLISLMCLFNNCEKIYPDDKLSLTKTEYTGQQLKIDGYYYTINKFSNKASVYVFFNNGVLLNAGDGYDLTVPNYIENSLSSTSFINKLKGIKFSWGLFNVEGNNISLERWYSSTGGPLKTYIDFGTIINDSTFQITNSMRSDGTEKRSENIIFKFKKFSPKPDSTNSFTP